MSAGSMPFSIVGDVVSVKAVDGLALGALPGLPPPHVTGVQSPSGPIRPTRCHRGQHSCPSTAVSLGFFRLLLGIPPPVAVPSPELGGAHASSVPHLATERGAKPRCGRHRTLGYGLHAKCYPQVGKHLTPGQVRKPVRLHIDATGGG